MIPIRLAAAFLLAGAPVALAQSAEPPARIANQANGRSYQPTLGGVASREQSAGVRPSDAQLSGEDRELNDINRQLLGPKAAPPVRTPGQ